MSKKAEEQQADIPVAVPQDTEQDAFAADIIVNGKGTLSANTREELIAMIDKIPANVRIMSGPIGFNPLTHTYIVKISTI
jgi:hypothetical protein